MAKRPAEPRVKIKDICYYPGNTTYVLELEADGAETRTIEIGRDNFDGTVKFLAEYKMTRLATMLLLQAVDAHIMSVRLD